MDAGLQRHVSDQVERFQTGANPNDRDRQRQAQTQCIKNCQRKRRKQMFESHNTY